MSDSDSKLIDFQSTEDQQKSEEICSPAFGIANPHEEPPQHQRVVQIGIPDEANQTAARQLFESCRNKSSKKKKNKKFQNNNAQIHAPSNKKLQICQDNSNSRPM